MVETVPTPAAETPPPPLSPERPTVPEAPIEEQAKLWEEKIGGRIMSAASGWGTRATAAISLALPNWRADRAARLATEAETSVNYYKNKIRDLRLQEASDRADIASLKIRASQSDQNPISRAWNKAQLKMALWGAGWKAGTRASLESKKGSAETRLANKLHAANTFDEHRRSVAERFTSKLAHRMEPLTDKTTKLEQRARDLGTLLEKGSERRKYFADRRAEYEAEMRGIDLSTSEGERRMEELAQKLEKTAGHIARLDSTLKRAGESLDKCATHHRRVARSCRFFSNASNKIINSITPKSIGSIPTHSETAAKSPPARRGFSSFLMRREGARARLTETHARIPDTTSADYEYAKEVAESISKSPMEFIREWNREYPEAPIMDLLRHCADAGIDTPPDFMKTSCTLWDFMNKITELYDKDEAFKTMIDGLAADRGFENPADLSEDFILTRF